MKISNTGGKISYNQYKLFDILLFLVIMVALEAVNVFAVKKWFPDMMFSVSLMFTVSLLALVRWNWLAAVFPIFHGIIYCAFLCAFQKVGYQEFIIYSAGNAFLLFSWFLFKFIPKEKMFSKWYLTLIYALVAFILVLCGRTLIAVCFGSDFVTALGNFFFTEALNIVFAAMALLVFRRLDGMVEDQKKYLLRVAREREEAQKPKEEVWAGYTELDEEELKKLHGCSDGGEEGDGISMYDEYPPESR